MTVYKIRFPARLLAGALALASLLMPASARAGDVLVFAAASLKTALDQVAADWREETGKDVSISYAGSSSLARQIEQGAPADVFISASVDWMDYLQSAGLIRVDTRIDLLGNRLVLIAHGPDAPSIDLEAGVDLSDVLADDRLAMALVDSVPAGVYGKQALMSLGQWDAVASKVAQTDNARAALALVSSGEAPMGIVYASDAVADGNVSVVAVFAEGTHAPIVYPAAVTASSESADATAFLKVLSGPAAAKIFKAQGFAPLFGQGDG